jgi:dolichyldiphosphatase
MEEGDGLHPLVPFQITLVYYRPGDTLAFASALLSLAPVVLCLVLGTLVLSRREPLAALLLVGLVGVAGACSALKGLLRDPRPKTPGLWHGAGDLYGMPSNHAAFAAFAAGFVGAWAASGRWRARGGGGALRRRAAAGAAGAAAAAVAASRVYLGYHSAAQVLVGAALGAGGGYAWYLFVEARLRPLFAPLAASALGRALGVRDCSDVEDVLAVEYEAVVAAAAAAAAVSAAVPAPAAVVLMPSQKPD